MLAFHRLLDSDYTSQMLFKSSRAILWHYALLTTAQVLNLILLSVPLTPRLSTEPRRQLFGTYTYKYFGIIFS